MPGLFTHWYIYLIILAVALIMFGPARLPELGASLGRALREFRKGATEMTEALKEEATKPATGTTYTATATPVEPVPGPGPERTPADSGATKS